MICLPLLLGAAAVPAAAAGAARRRSSSRSPEPASTSARPAKSTRVPDVAIISAGVVTRAATASAAIQQNAARMERVRAALKRAGIADRDIQTSNISLNPEYRYENNQPPQLTGYTASNSVTVRFRDISQRRARSSMRWSRRARTRSTARR